MGLKQIGDHTDFSSERISDICKVSGDAMQELVQKLFYQLGCSKEESTRIAKLLVRANLRGHDSHGLVRVNRYVKWLKSGILVPNQHATVISDNGAILELDGNYGFGQTVGEEAVRFGIDKALAHGVAVVSIRHAGHLGVIGDWANLAAEEGFISIHMVNVRGSLLVAPFGGTDRRASTAPFCAGVPRKGKPPILVDFATSMVAEGKALVALKGGPSLPEGALISKNGQLTSDPNELYGDTQLNEYPDARSGPGALTSFGLHKGYTLNFLMEVLGGALTGSGVAGTSGDDKRGICNGMLSIYLDSKKMSSAKFFEEELDSYCNYVRSSRSNSDGQMQRVLLPGENEEQTIKIRLAGGLPIPYTTLTDICCVAKENGISIDESSLLVSNFE